MNFPTSKMVHLRDATLGSSRPGSRAALLCYAMAGRSKRLAIDTRFLRWSMLDTIALFLISEDMEPHQTCRCC